MFIVIWIIDVSNVDIAGWGYSPRGAGYLFGGDVVQTVGILLMD